MAHEDIVQHTRNLTEVYDNIQQQNSEKYLHPPTVTPKLISYNLHKSEEKQSYSQVTKDSKQQYSTVIEPTFTEIDWKEQTRKMQQDTIDKCKKMTQLMITEACNNIHKEINVNLQEHRE